MLGIVPSIVAPRGNRARLKLATAFEKYFENYKPEHTESSSMTRARYAEGTQHGITLHNQGRLEAGLLIGILANTIPALFYMLVHVYSDPILLQDIRNELEATSVATMIPSKKSTRRRQLGILTMRAKCSLLHSTFQEVLRIHALGTNARFVREDVLLDNRYLLRKGMVVQIPIAGGKTFVDRLSCFCSGILQAPSTGSKSNLNTIQATTAKISKVTKCRPGHNDVPPPKAR